jgi:L-alanine-DL-glutamate epimerase-like enolase superfamily enzyme
MTITDVDFFLVDVSCLGPFDPVRSLLVRLSTPSGLEGWGEAQLEWRREELAARRNALLPVLTGRSVFDIEDLLGLAALRLAPLRCAVEMACWDLVGQVAGQPLCHLFGGGYRQRVPLAVRLGGSSSEEVAQLARELAEQGFHAQIVGSLGRLEDDLEMVAAIRQLIQDRAELAFDGAANYDMESARDLCGGLENAGVQYVLDPLKTRDLDQVASLRRQTSVPLGVRRSIRSPADVLAVVRCGAAAVVVVDLQRVGGLTTAKKCAAIAQAAGLEACLASGPSLGVGMAAMLQLAAATPAFSHCNQCARHLAQDDLLVESLELVDGMLAVPQGPGLGVQVDRAKLDK